MSRQKAVLMFNLLLGLGLLALAGPARAAFKDNSWGARPSGMGGAFTALADDSNALHWNPAGGAQAQRKELSVMYADLFSGLENVSASLNSFSYMHPTQKQGSYAVAWNNQTVSGLYREDTFVLSHARRLSPSAWNNQGLPAFFGGASVKYLRNSFSLDQRSSIDPVFSGGRDQTAVGIDAGLLARLDQWSWGLSFLNLNEPAIGLVAKERVPLELRTGLAYTAPGFFVFDASSLSVDYVQRDGVKSVQAGTENWLLEKRAALRAGVNDREITFGLGFRHALNPVDLMLDYAYVLPMRLTESTSRTHRLSLGVRFGGAASAASAAPRKARLPKSDRVREVGTSFAWQGNEEEPVTPTAAQAKGPEAVVYARQEVVQIQKKIEEKEIPPIMFITGSNRLMSESLPTIDQVVKVLRGYPNLKVRIIGYEPATPASVDTSENLSIALAKNVANYIIARGIPKDRLVPEAAPSASSAQGTQDQSIEFVFFDPNR
jgi:outer membrane protein OmpA-like peptidoglycan-associated protein